jgi:hypothetical protein
MFSKIALILAVILYLVIAGQNLYNKDYPHCLMWVAYSIANMAMLWYETTKEI